MSEELRPRDLWARVRRFDIWACEADDAPYVEHAEQPNGEYMLSSEVDAARAADAASLSARAVCPHCKLPAVMPDTCTLEVGAVIDAQIEADWTLFEVGYEAGKRALAELRAERDEARHQASVLSTAKEEIIVALQQQLSQAQAELEVLRKR